MSFLVIINFLGFCLGFMACCILLFANKTQRHANNLLVISIASLTLSMLHASLITSGYIIWFPYLFRAFSPVFYLIIPAAYLYLRTVLLDEARFQKWDYLHFIPALLHLFELIPWYSIDITSKRELVSRYLTEPNFAVQPKEVLLSIYTHGIIRSILATGYLIAMHQLLRKTSLLKEGPFKIARSTAFRWLQTFSYLLTFFVISITLAVVIPVPGVARNAVINIIISIIFIIINFYLFSKPQILYGIPHIHQWPEKQPAVMITIKEPTELLPQIERTQSFEDEVHSPEISHSALEYLEAYQPLVEGHLSATKPFLKQGYSLIQLSDETGIPRHHLSALLNKIYGTRFNDFINLYRIQYITQHMDDPEWPKLTLEGIAREAGFNSRTTFFNAIKKFTGLSPTEFLEKAKNKQIDFFQKDLIL